MKILNVRNLIFVFNFFSFLILPVKANQRYIWLNVPYIFHESERYIEEQEICTNSSQKNWDNDSISKKKNRKCTYTPARYIPAKEIKRTLRVHVDCKDKTYDAKGDGKGWRDIGMEKNVLNSSIKPCIKLGFSMDTYLNSMTIEEKNKIFTKGSINYNSSRNQISVYNKCLEDSLNSINKDQFINIKNPEDIGLSSGSQVFAYYLRIKSKLANACKKIVTPKNKGLSKLEIDLKIWAPIELEAFEYTLKNVTNCTAKEF